MSYFLRPRKKQNSESDQDSVTSANPENSSESDFQTPNSDRNLPESSEFNVTSPSESRLVVKNLDFDIDFESDLEEESENTIAGQPIQGDTEETQAPESEIIVFDKSLALKFIPECSGVRDELHKFINCCDLLNDDYN